MKASRVFEASAVGALGVSAALAYQQLDKQINAPVIAVFQQHLDPEPTLTPHNNGIVYSTGSLATGLPRQTAEQPASAVSGVKKLIDHAGLEQGSD